AVQDDGRTSGAAHHLDVPPPHAVAVAGPERLHDRLLGGKARREALRVTRPLEAVRGLAAGEHALAEALAPLRVIDGAANAFALDGVRTDRDDHAPAITPHCAPTCRPTHGGMRYAPSARRARRARRRVARRRLLSRERLAAFDTEKALGDAVVDEVPRQQL